MLIPLALALAPRVFADIRDDYKAGLAAEVSAAIAADNSNLGKSSEALAADKLSDSNSYILGIGDPENYHPYAVDCPSRNTTWVRPASGVSGACGWSGTGAG